MGGEIGVPTDLLGVIGLLIAAAVSIYGSRLTRGSADRGANAEAYRDAVQTWESRIKTIKDDCDYLRERDSRHSEELDDLRERDELSTREIRVLREDRDADRAFIRAFIVWGRTVVSLLGEHNITAPAMPSGVARYDLAEENEDR